MEKHYTVEIYSEEYGAAFFFDDKWFISEKGRESKMNKARRFTSEKQAREFASNWILKKDLKFKIFMHSPNRVDDLTPCLKIVE